MSSRIAQHIDFPNYSRSELMEIANKMLANMHSKLDQKAQIAMNEYIAQWQSKPHFANTRSIINGLDRARLRHASRVLETASGNASIEDLSTITESDIRASRVFNKTETSKS
ncbi:MAG: hypothetical protein ACKVOA_06495 [Methylophilaceae bacterium]